MSFFLLKLYFLVDTFLPCFAQGGASHHVGSTGSVVSLQSVEPQPRQQKRKTKGPRQQPKAVHDQPLNPAFELGGQFEDDEELEAFVQRRGVVPEEGLSFQMKASLSLGDVDQEEMLRAVGYDFEYPGRERLFVHDTAGFDIFSFPFQELGKKRLAYNDVAHFVHS